MADLETWLIYHLPRTRVRVTGTVTERFDLREGKPVRKVQSQVALETGADPEAFYRIELHKAKLSDQTFALELTEDGRLVSTEARSVGKVGKIVRNVFSFITTVASAVGQLTLLSSGAAPFLAFKAEEAEDPVEAQYAREHPEQAKLRKRVRDVLAKTHQKIVGLEEMLLDSTAEERKKIQAHLGDLKSSQEVLVKEAQRLDVHFQAWKASKQQETTAELQLTFEVSDLPTVSEVESWTGLPSEEQLGPFAAAYRGLDLVVARRDVEPLPSHSVPEAVAPGGKAPGVFFRQARALELCLYVIKDNGLSRIKKTTELVMDGQCRLGFVEFGKTRWSEESAEVKFSELGGLKSLKNSKASELAAATDTLKELPSDLKDALSKANEIIDEQQKLELQGVEQRIAELEKQKSLVEKEIALGGVLDTREAAEELTRLKAEVEILKARKDLGIAERDLRQVEAGSTIQLETEILKLRTALEQAQIERIKVEKELKELQVGEE